MIKYLIIILSSVILAQSSVYVQPSHYTINSAGSVSIQVFAANVTNLHSASVTISFNNSVLTYTSITNGTFLQSNPNGYSVFVGKTFYPNTTTPNQIKVDQAILGSSSVSGSGLLFTINFNTNHAGRTGITVSDVVLMDLNSNEISSSSISGEVTVSINISPKVLLQGPYNGSTMNCSLNPGFIPNSQPYFTAPWSYNGSENVSEGFFALHNNIVDWVLIELRSGTLSNSVVSRRACFILNNGNIVDIDGVSPVIISGPSAGNYYIVIKHRNHLSVMTANTQSLDLTNTSYDFTTAQTQAYNSSYNPMKSLSGGKFGLYAGDANSDGSVDAIDNNLFWRPNNGLPFNYSKGADFNMDASIDALDINTDWRPNNGKGTQVPF